ncbi:MAG: xanthine dehydrogenase family protein molybdopterin-binding subunit [SAR202 cluster bacterium]|nr:xanthine dehydrogenase family protein molybdopterin-binding subunit [SAR202 cluster bacterium]
MTSGKYRVIGKDTPKTDGIDKVTGRAKFGADIYLPGMLVGKVLRSPHAHAVIKSIDTGQAEALSGVKAVVTSDDIPDLSPGDPSRQGTITDHDFYLSRELMAREKALFHGHTVAAVAATDESIAEEALSLIDVEYEVLPHVLEPEVAMRGDAPLLHETLRTRSQSGTSDESSNLAEHWELSRGDIERGFAEADSIVEESFSSQIVHQGYVEPDCETAHVHPDGTVEVWANTQSIYSTRSDLAVLLDIPLGDITVNPTELGGAFGGKEPLRASGLATALSKKALLPVQVRFSREEVLRGTGPGNAIRSTVKIGARSDGTITAIQARMVFDAGAFPGAPLRSAIRRVFSHYRTPNLKIDAFDVVTNKPHVAAYRAPGGTPTAFSVESAIDDLAASLSIDPMEFRLRNVSLPGDPMPDGDLLTSLNFTEVLDRVKQHPCWTSPLEGKNQGRGLALGMWSMPGGTASCHVNLNGDGSVTLVLGTPDLSGTRTSLGLVAAEALGLDISDVKVAIANTDAVAYSDASAGDRITYIASIAVGRACDSLIEAMKVRVASEFDTSPEHIGYSENRFSASGVPEMSVSWDDMALRSVRGDGALSAGGAASEMPDGAAIAPNATAHVVDVEVDPETGKVDLLRYTTFQDAGLAVNPAQVEGQMQGGATQGIGWALSEEYNYDDSGVLQNASLLDYRLQTSADVPFIDAEIIEIPSEAHPLGIRAVGQAPIVPPAGAIGNAIYNAVGVRMRQLPMKPERVYMAIRNSES